MQPGVGEARSMMRELGIVDRLLAPVRRSGTPETGTASPGNHEVKLESSSPIPRRLMREKMTCVPEEPISIPTLRSEHDPDPQGIVLERRAARSDRGLIGRLVRVVTVDRNHGVEMVLQL